MYLKNIVEKADTVKVKGKYDLTYKNMIELLEAYGGKPVELIYIAFKIGYLQGTKATKADRR